MSDDKSREEDAQKQLELMQKMLDDARRVLEEIHREVKARRDAEKPSGGDAGKTDA